MRTTLPALALLSMALVSCGVSEAPTGGTVPPASGSGLTWVAVTGPADSEAPEDLVLEVGGGARHGYGGVVSIETGQTVPVRLIGRASCRSYAAFDAPAGTMWVIRFAADGTVRIEDWTERGVDAGPALGELPASGC